MAYFAELDDQNTVLRVVSIGNDVLLDSGAEVEQKGIDFCQQLFKGGVWKQTSFTGSKRKNFAGTGCTYDPMRDAFIAPKPDGDYWLLDEQTCRWVDPTPPVNATIGVTRV